MIGLVNSVPSNPYPVYGVAKVGGVVYAGVNLIVTNLDTGDSTSVVTNSKGQYVVDLGNFPNGYRNGQRISIKYCNEPTGCIYQTTISGDGMEVNLDVPESTVTKYVCWDNSQVLNPANCPVQPVVTEVVTLESEGNDAKITVDYGQDINFIIGDNKLPTLQDKEIEFNDKDYNIHEELTIKGKMMTSLDDEDFTDKPYLTFKEGDITYKYIFEDAIPKNEVTEKEPLKITFLGENKEIVSITDTKITLMSGKVITIEEGATVDNIKADVITTDKVYLTYNNDGGNIEEGKIGTIGGMEFYIIDIMENEAGESTGGDRVEIRYGKEVKTEIENDMDYDDKDVWKWIVTINSIGITNQQEYRYLDEDDTKENPFTIGDSISLPKFITITFKEITTPKNYELKIKTKPDNFLYVYSSDKIFTIGTNDYDRLYVKQNGFYDEDKVFLTTQKVKIGDSDKYLELSSLKIGLLELAIDLSDIKYNGISFAGKEDTYLGYEGLLFKDPKQAIEDKSFIVNVPEEQPEAIILITTGEVAEQPEVVTVPVTPEQPVTPETPVTPIQPVTPVEPEVIVKEKIVCADGTEVTDKSLCVEPEGMSVIWKGIIGLAIFVLGLFGWGKGFTALANYYYKKGEELEAQGKKAEAKKMYDRAASMLKTALKKAQEGKYKK